VVTEECKCQ